MFRHAKFVLFLCLLLSGTAWGADKEVKGKLAAVDFKKSTLSVVTDVGKEETYDVNESTKFVGPKGGASDDGIKDDRLVAGAELTLLVAGNNRTLREVRMPARKPKSR